MNAGSTSTKLVIGLAVLGVGLVVAGIRISRRKTARAAGRSPRAETRFLGDSNDQAIVPGKAEMHHPDDDANIPDGKSLLAFFVYTFILAIPFWRYGGGKLPLPINLPVGALATFVPMTAAAIVTYQQHGFNGVRALLKKLLDYRKIKDKTWYLPALLVVPVINLVAYVMMRLAGLPLPDRVQIPLAMAPVFFVIFFIGGVGEELGWTGYALEPMQKRWGALTAGLILGIIWVSWHIIPWIQTGNAASWIVWQGLFSVALRVLIVWIYNNSGKSVFAAVLVHVTSNLSWSLFPNYGTHYDPFVTGLIAWLTVAIIIFMWEPATLAHTRRADRHPI